MNLNDTTLYVGTVGFSYDAWANGIFYPSELPRSKWLSYYSQFFNFVEISHSFSKVPDKDTFQQWYDQSPETFRFSLRGNQYITHVKKLKGVGEPLKLFLEPALKLREKLSSIVWEVPPLGRDQIKTLEAFVKHLQKYPKIRHFFDFSEEMVIEQKSFQLLSENNYEIIVNLPHDTVIENRHYFRISLQDRSLGEEWQADLLSRLKADPSSKSAYILFDGPQSGNSCIRARAFMEKIHQLS